MKFLILGSRLMAFYYFCIGVFVMESNSTIAVLVLLMASLLVGAILKIILKKSPLPYTVGLFIVGLSIGIADRLGWFSSLPMIHLSLHSIGYSDPHTLLYLFLPILIFDAAYEMDFHIFRKNLLNAIILAIPGVVVGMVLSAALMMLLRMFFPGYEGWTWTISMMFGALISATDPVAVVSLLRELKTSKRFSTLVDAESLLNDGTGIVLFMIFFNSYISGGMASGEAALLEFVKVVLGGIVLGVGLSAICLWVVAKVKGDSNLQNSIIILCSYLNFLIAESLLHVSGVIALVAYGLAISYYGKLELNKNINTFVGEFWELAAYIANTLIFIIVGIVIALKVKITLHNVIVLLVVYVGIMAIRLVTVFIFFPLMRRLGYGLDKREGFILAWGGLRGAVGLTLALIVASTEQFPNEVAEQVLFLTAGIVALTLAVNATTIGGLLKRLGLTHHPLVESIVENSVNGKMLSEAENYLKEIKSIHNLETADWDVVESLLPKKIDLSGLPDLDDNLVQQALRTKILEQESDLCWKLYNRGVFSRRVLREISRVVELQNDADGQAPLTQQQRVIGEFIGDKQFKRWKWFPYIQRRVVSILEKRVIRQFEICRCFTILQHSSLTLIRFIDESSSFPEAEKPNLNTLKEEIESNLNAANKIITLIASTYPHIYKRAVTEKASNMLLTKIAEIQRRFRSEGYIR